MTNPLLWERGIKTMLGVPLVTGDSFWVYCMSADSPSDRSVRMESELLEMVGADSGAVQTSMFRDKLTAAKVLQRSLLPSALPQSPHLRLASRYLPAEHGGVGGDWYDAFSLPSGEFWVMTGDVTRGHGLRPAVIMGRLRSTLRSYAFEGWPPEKVLHLADQKLKHFERRATATVACAVFSPPFDHFDLALAGHLPPVLAGPARSTGS